MTSTTPSHRATESGKTKRLRREVFPPRAPSGTAAVLLAGSTVASFAVILTAMGLAASTSSQQHQAAPAVVHIIHTGDARPGASLPAVGEPYAESADAELPPGAEASLVTEFDGRTFAVLGRAPDELLDADRFELLGELHDLEGAIAPVDGEALGELAAWDGREVRVGDGCTARVTGFALLSPMLGTVEYLPLETWEPSEADIITALLDIGETVIAAELHGCDEQVAAAVGAPVIARDASLFAMVEPERLDRPALAQRARAHLIASDTSKAAQRDYAGVRDDAQPWWQLPMAEIEVEVLRHPTTEDVWVSVQASADEGCGFAAINLWGLYEVRGDELEPIAIHELELGARLQRAVDLDGDGELSWIASRLFGSSAIYGADGATRTEIDVPFFGCAC